MNTIPLHQLPDEAFLCVLQSMEIYDQLAYSFCSKKAKKSIKSLNLKAQHVDFNVADSIEVKIHVQNLSIIWSSMEHNNYFPNNRIIVHEGIRFTLTKSEETTTDEWVWDFGTWNFENLEFKEWLHHFCEVLHHPQIDHFHFYGENLDDDYIEPVQNVVKGLQIGCLGTWLESTTDFAGKVLESFPNYEKLFLCQTSFDSHKLNKLLVQNLKSICIPEAERLNIDQVLLTNSGRIQLDRSLFTEKDLNRFLKLWIRGSNPRLKFLYTRGQPQLGNDSLDKNVILKGITHNQISLDSEEVYGGFIDYYYDEIKLAGGSRIWSFKGTTAVIVVTEREFLFIVE